MGPALIGEEMDDSVDLTPGDLFNQYLPNTDGYL